jgi:hypothetical protein
MLAAKASQAEGAVRFEGRAKRDRRAIAAKLVAGFWLWGSSLGRSKVAVPIPCPVRWLRLDGRSSG